MAVNLNERRSDAQRIFAWAAQVYDGVADEVLPGMRTVILQIDQYKWRVQFLWDLKAHQGGATVGYTKDFDWQDLESLKTAEGTFFAERAMEELVRKFPRSGQKAS